MSKAELCMNAKYQKKINETYVLRPHYICLELDPARGQETCQDCQEEQKSLNILLHL